MLEKLKWDNLPRWVRWIFEGLLLLLVLIAISVWQQRDHLRGDSPVRQLTAIDHHEILIPISNDSTTLFHFSASWCPICQMMQSNVESIGSDNPVVYVLVQMSEQEEADWLKKHSNIDRAFIVRDEFGLLLKQFGGKALPMDVFISPNAMIVMSEQGFTSEVGLRIRLWWANLSAH